MRKNLILLTSLVFIASCSSSAQLEIPPIPEPPAGWNQFSSLTLPNSSCPKIAGEYSEPPLIYRSVEQVEDNLKGKTGTYYGHFPFHLADRNELTIVETNLSSNQFSIRQPDADNFFFTFVTPKAIVIEYHFQAEEDDFNCKDGYIEFPVFISDGMIEGMSVNSQIRNAVLQDITGALVIHTTIGPYRGDPTITSNQFTHQLLRYQLSDRILDRD